MYLLSLCTKYALRFFVVSDRYAFVDLNGVKRRSIEDIKERYYQIAAAVSVRDNSIEEKAFEYNKSTQLLPLTYHFLVSFKLARLKGKRILRCYTHVHPHNLLYLSSLPVQHLGRGVSYS
jgi:SANT/Myb-like domain of DAMP1